MKLSTVVSSIFLFSGCLALPSLAHADFAKCRISAAGPGSPYADYVGGKVTIDLETGNTILVPIEVSENLPVAFPVSSSFISSFEAPRTACIFGTEKFLRSDGSLRAMLFKFNDCMHHHATNPEWRGYVKADVSFDLLSATGKYREIFLTPTGTPPSSWVDFDTCRIETR